jgi:hypothetical protein
VEAVNAFEGAVIVVTHITAPHRVRTCVRVRAGFACRTSSSTDRSGRSRSTFVCPKYPIFRFIDGFTAPVTGASSPASRRSRVVFPRPFGPTTAIRSPFATGNDSLSMRGCRTSYPKERSRTSIIHFPVKGASANRKSRSRISVSFARRSWRASALIRDWTARALVACARNRAMNSSESFRFFSSFFRVCSWISSSWRICP